MRVVWKCPCDKAFGTSHSRNFAFEGDLSRVDQDGVRQVYDWRRFCHWLTSEGPAIELWVDNIHVWEHGKWLVEEMRSTCVDGTNAFIEFLLERPDLRRGTHGQATG